MPSEALPPKVIGGVAMAGHFAAATGDVKIFVDNSEPELFFGTPQNELLPRLGGRQWQRRWQWR